MKLKEVADALERFAPLPLQESYDNAGLQIGLTEADISRVLLCLDVTEAVIEEAITKKCQLIVSHHPLLFSGVKCISDNTMVGRCIMRAIENGIAVYAAHTNLDNAPQGVCVEMARILGLEDVRFLLPKAEGNGGEGVLGKLKTPMPIAIFQQQLKALFHVPSMRCNRGGKSMVSQIALCGGSGAFLLDTAVQQGADVFITGEMSYHKFFEHENDIHIAVLGHYESEYYVVHLFKRVLQEAFPSLEILITEKNTNPIKHI